MALEVLMVVSIVTGFSFGVPKAQILGTECVMLGERVGRDGRWATDDHIEAVGRMKPVEDVSQLRGLLGLANWVKDHCPAEYVLPLKVLTKWLKKGATFPLDAEGRAAEKALKALVKRNVRLDALDEVSALNGTRALQQVADACKYGWGGSIMQVGAGGTTLYVSAMFSGLMTDAQSL